MKKAITTLVLIISIFLAVLIIVLSTNGIETNRFNNFISQKINQSNNNINLELNSIVFKLDIKEMSLFLDTPKPKINYRNTAIPAEKIKVYIDFISLIKSNPKIKKIKLVLEEIDINQLKNLSTAIKPSNFKSLIDNKIKQGKLISELEFFFDKDNLVENFIAKGSVSNFKTEIIKNLNFDKANFNFFADKTDILIKNIFGELDNIKITDGDLKIMLSPEISLESNFKTNFKYNNNSFINLSNLIKEFTYADDITSLKGDFNNYLSINFDKTYKVTNYKYENNGKILEANLNFKKPFHNILSQEKINQLSIINSEITTSFSPKKSKTTILGKYSLNTSYGNDNLLLLSLKPTFKIFFWGSCQA